MKLSQPALLGWQTGHVTWGCRRTIYQGRQGNAPFLEKQEIMKLLFPVFYHFSSNTSLYKINIVMISKFSSVYSSSLSVFVQHIGILFHIVSTNTSAEQYCTGPSHASYHSEHKPLKNELCWWLASSDCRCFHCKLNTRGSNRLSNISAVSPELSTEPQRRLWDFLHVCKYLMGKRRSQEKALLRGAQWQYERQWPQTESKESHLKMRKNYSCAREDLALMCEDML